jgi:hypothetical protein
VFDIIRGPWDKIGVYRCPNPEINLASKLQRRQMNISPKFGGAVPTTNEGILDLLKGSKFIEDAAAAKTRDVTAFRKTKADKLMASVAAATLALPKLRVKRETSIAAAREIEIKWRAACDPSQQDQRDLSSASFTFSDEQQKLESQLIETASPEIAIFLSDMRDEWEKYFKQFAFHNSTETVNHITGKRAVTNTNNRASVMARQAAIRDAQAMAEAMRLEPDQSTVPSQLQQLRNNLPAITSI